MWSRFARSRSTQVAMQATQMMKTTGNRSSLMSSVRHQAGRRVASERMTKMHKLVAWVVQARLPTEEPSITIVAMTPQWSSPLIARSCHKTNGKTTSVTSSSTSGTICKKKSKSWRRKSAQVTLRRHPIWWPRTSWRKRWSRKEWLKAFASSRDRCHP